jgi:hypothetical protein
LDSRGIEMKFWIGVCFYAVLCGYSDGACTRSPKESAPFADDTDDTVSAASIFTAHQDKLLQNAVADYGVDNWKEVAKHVRRSARDCRWRWNVLQDKEWDKDSDKFLILIAPKLKLDWPVITKHFPRHPETSVKARYKYLRDKDLRDMESRFPELARPSVADCDTQSGETVVWPTVTEKRFGSEFTVLEPEHFPKVPNIYTTSDLPRGFPASDFSGFGTPVLSNAELSAIDTDDEDPFAIDTEDEIPLR